MSLARENKALNAILRELVKQPDNKLCADCKKNDARWASVNLGVFMCIRCSGIHRSLGVHITRIKSIDLDTWTPEQISNVQRWGNRRANKYWEAHLKPGHIPPDHKMDSFIRSKYESKRWAMEGPVPQPETLDDEGFIPSHTESAPSPTRQTSRAAAISDEIDFLSGPVASPAAKPVTRSANATAAARQPPPPATSHPQPSTTKAPPKTGNGGGLFDLDFAEPTSAPSSTARPSSSKADILSLFSKPAPTRPQTTTDFAQPAAAPSRAPALTDAFEGLSFGTSSSAAYAQPSQTLPPQYQQQQQQQHNTSSSAYAPQPANPWAAPPPAPPQQQSSHRANDSYSSANQNAYPSQPQHNAQPARSAPQTNNFSGLFDSADVWGAPAGQSSSGGSTQPTHTSQVPSSSAFEFGDFSSSSTSAPPASHGGFATSSAASSKVPAFDDFGDIWKS